MQSFWQQSRCFVAPEQQGQTVLHKPLRTAGAILILGIGVYQQKAQVCRKMALIRC